MKTGRGNLLQIFIPKAMVDQCAYLATYAGYPFGDSLGSKQYYDQTLKYRKQISPFLQDCEVDKIPNDILKQVQARILVTSDIMLNPQSGVKIFRETALPEDKTTKYAQQMDHITTEIIIDWLNRYLNPGKDPDQQIKPQALTRIKDTPFGQLIADKQRASVLLHRLNTTNSIAQFLPLAKTMKMIIFLRV